MPVIQNLGRAATALLILAVCLLCGCMEPGPRALLKGDKLLNEGKYQEAIPHLQRAVKLLPKFAQAHNLLGLAYHRTQQLDPAQRCYIQALSLDQNLAAARFNLGCLYLEQNNLQPAIDQLTSFTYLQPNEAAGWLKLGIAQNRARRWDAAEKSLRAALALQPRDPEIWNNMGTAQYQRRQVQDALNCFNQALALNPHHAPALLNAAVVSHQSVNNRPAALQLYRRYLALQPRPANWESVSATALQLEAELNPAPLPLTPIMVAPTRNPPTNPVSSNVAVAVASAVTNERMSKPVVPTAASNSVAAATQVPPSLVVSPVLTQSQPLLLALKPVTNRASISPPPASNTVAVTSENPPDPPNLPVEVTQIQEDFIVKPAQDIPPIPAPPATNHESSPRPAILPRPATLTATTNMSAKPAKRTWLSRLNPFQNKSRQPTDHVTVIAPPSVPPPELVKSQEPERELPPPMPDKPKPSFPRYSYRSPQKTTPGNRAEAERFFSKGLKAQKAGNADDAVEEYQRAVQADPGYFQAHHNLGLAAFELHDWQKSLRAYENALAIRPESVDTRYNFALALKQGRYIEDAAEELRKVLVAQPEDVRAHYSLAKLYAYHLQEPELAREHFLKVLEFEPQHSQATEIRYWLAAQARADHSR